MSTILSISDITIASIEWEYDIIQILLQLGLKKKLDRSVRSIYVHIYSDYIDLSSYVSLTTVTIDHVDHKTTLPPLPSSVTCLTILSSKLRIDEMKRVIPCNLVEFHCPDHEDQYKEYRPYLPIGTIIYFNATNW